MEISKDFFDLPKDEKDKYSRDEDIQQGYVEPGREIFTDTTKEVKIWTLLIIFLQNMVRFENFEFSQAFYQLRSGCVFLPVSVQDLRSEGQTWGSSRVFLQTMLNFEIS